LISVGALVGKALTPGKSLTTLPVTAGVVGGAVATFFASLLMQRIGRRAGFTLGALHRRSGRVRLLSSGSCFRASGAFCAGARSCSAPTTRSAVLPIRCCRGLRSRKAGARHLARARRWLVGGILGPYTSRHTRGLLATAYLGSYLSLFAFLALVLVAQRFIVLPKADAGASSEPARPLGVIVREPSFVVAVMASAFGYGIMSLLMTATPLAHERVRAPLRRRRDGHLVPRRRDVRAVARLRGA
jgi:MFS family permease